jgi:hypothetical protein
MMVAEIPRSFEYEKDFGKKTLESCAVLFYDSGTLP